MATLEQEQQKESFGGQLMSDEDGHRAIILVVEDVEETRDGIEDLLKADGYRLIPVRDEEDAVERARRERLT